MVSPASWFFHKALGHLGFARAAQMTRDIDSASWECIVTELQRAHSQWQLDDPRSAIRLFEPAISLPRAKAEQLVARARQLAAAKPATPSGERDSAIIVTKAPHTGSDLTVAAILARCLAFGLSVERVTRQPPEDADRIAHALYPDVWLNFVRLPSAEMAWSRIDATFDKEDYATIFGERYRRAAVVTGHQACQDNQLTQAELMAIWQTGREPLTRSAALSVYGRSGAEAIFGADDVDLYPWYRGPRPVGIQKIGPNLMAFSLRHERLYDGRPVIVMNGHFTLLSQRFRGVGDRGATVIELGLDDHPAIRDIRLRLIGAADRPEECLPGTIRRDAWEGFFFTDASDEPVVPWANAVHASDGYLAGAIEAAAVFGEWGTSSMARRLSGLGYSSVEIDRLIMKDPIVPAYGDEQHLTKRTAMLPRDRCLAEVGRWFPPLSADGAPPASAYLLSALIGAGDSGRPNFAVDRPQPEPDSRHPATGSIRDCTDLPHSLIREGEELIAAGGLGLLVPLAGSGGRFGGYDVAEGQGPRLKPLLPVFDIGGTDVSSMDVRAAHAHFLARRGGAPVRMLLSCSHATEPRAKEWLARNAEVEAEVVRVPEMYRLRTDRWDANADAPDVSAADSILRDLNGAPVLKPSGSLGLLMAAAQSGVLSRWQQHGVQVVVAANADDVAFRVDPQIVGMFAASPAVDAVVLTTPFIDDRTAATARAQRGGLLRERPAGESWSAYVEEHAGATATSGDEQFSTNQIYFRLQSLCQLLTDRTADGMDAIRRRLPVYFEVKEVHVGDQQVGALHAYQTYGDVLRLLPSVEAVSMTRAPRPGQPRGYAPLKSPSDVGVAQAVLDAVSALRNELLFAVSLQGKQSTD